MSTPLAASRRTLRVLGVTSLGSALLGVPLIAAGTHLVTGYGIRDVVLAVGFLLAVAAVVLAVLGLVLSTRLRLFVAALIVTAGWSVIAVVGLALGVLPR